MSTVSWRAETRGVVRSRILSAAVDELVAHGWAGLTVASVAEAAGVRRQAVYETVGTKLDLGRAVVSREAGGYLDEVQRRIRAGSHPVESLMGAVEYALSEGSRNRVLRVVLGLDGRPPEPELLAMVTADRQPILVPALSLVRDAFAATYPAVDPGRARVACDATVRLTLSHLFQPLKSRGEAVADIHAVVAALLGDQRP